MTQPNDTPAKREITIRADKLAKVREVIDWVDDELRNTQYREMASKTKEALAILDELGVE